MSVSIIRADARALPLRDDSIDCCVTSPPYFGLRDYGTAGQIGLEKTPDEYVAQLVAAFREVRRVLKDPGTLFLNLGDSFAGSRAGEQGATGQMADRTVAKARCRVRAGGASDEIVRGKRNAPRWGGGNIPSGGGLKPKDLIGIPWMVAFALRADGWWLRSDIIWSKPNPMPESVRDRPTKAHEYVFLLSKSETYHYDADAIAEPAIHSGRVVKATDAASAKNGQNGDFGATALGFTQHDTLVGDTRNKRTIWTVATKPYGGAHFAVMPEALAEPCILAGCPEGGTVLDPFGGSGTVGRVAVKHRRNAVLVDLNPDYLALAEERTTDVQIGLAGVA